MGGQGLTVKNKVEQQRVGLDWADSWRNWHGIEKGEQLRVGERVESGADDDSRGRCQGGSCMCHYTGFLEDQGQSLEE